MSQGAKHSQCLVLPTVDDIECLVRRKGPAPYREALAALIAATMGRATMSPEHSIGVTDSISAPQKLGRED